MSPEEIGRVRRLLEQAGRQDAATADDVGLLRDPRLLTEQDEMTNAGPLLVGRAGALREAVPGYDYAYQFRPSPGSEATVRCRESRPLLAAVERLVDTVEVARSVHALNVSGGVQLQLQDYPTAAVRELVVNALVHGDYEVSGSVDLEHSAKASIGCTAR